MNFLDFDYFKISLKTTIYNSDLSNLRKYYAPILDHLSILLYEYLNDLAKNNDLVTPYSFATLNLLLNTNETNLHQARMQLEALGLINTYKDNESATIILELHKPLQGQEIIKNPFISQMIKQKVGDANFKRLTSLPNKVVINNFAFEDISANFFNVFQESLTNSQNIVKNFYLKTGQDHINEDKIKNIVKQREVYTKLEVSNIKYANDYQALMQLRPSEFIMQMTNNDNFELNEGFLETWSNVFKESKTLNLVIYYSIKRYKNDTWPKYVNLLIKELSDTYLNEFSEVEAYLDGKFKNSTRTKKMYEEKLILKNDYLKGLKNV